MSSKNVPNLNSMLYMSFNQDNKFFSIGTENDFFIYKTDPFKGPYKGNMKGGIGVVEMIENSNFIALMGGGTIPRYGKNTLVIWDDNEKRAISELKFSTPIKLVKYKKDYLFVICQKMIYIFYFENFQNLYKIETGDNTKELIAINQSPKNTIIAYPSKKGGKITIKKIFSNINEDNKSEESYQLHDDGVSKISINYTGTLIASANENGTIIRIHSCEDGSFLMEFKRGHDKAKINTICFDNETKFMAVSSSKGTIHIFSMGSTMKKLKENEMIKEKKKINNKDKKENKKKEKKEKKEKNKMNKKDEINKEIKEENKIEENKDENKKEENKKEEIKEENKKEEQKDDNKIEEIKEENKIEEIKDEIKIEEQKDEIKIEEINDKNKILNINNEEKEEEIKISEDEENIIIEKKNSEKKNKINQNETKENQKKEEEDELPENTKSFFGGIFGSQTEKSFAKVRLKPQESICAFIKSDLISIVTTDYKYYQYKIDLKKGGNCEQITEEKLNLN